METLLTILGGTLGILVPFLFIFTLLKGIEKAPFEEIKKSLYKRNTVIGVLTWTALVWILAIADVFSYHLGDNIPRFVIALFIPVLIGLFLLTNKTFQTIINHTPLANLVGAQTFRLAGASLLLIVYAGVLPIAFNSGGYGDILTGSLALIAAILLSKKSQTSSLFFWAFSLSGLLDLLNVAYMLLAYYPLYNNTLPSSAAAADFSLIMLPAIAAPIALLLHLYAIRNFLLKKSN